MITGKVDFNLIKQASQDQLVQLLQSVPGSKAIVWDKQLAGTFELVANISFLRSQNVTKMFFISKGKLPENNVSNIIFLSRPKTSLMDLINSQIRSETSMGTSNKEYHLWLVPNISLLCMQRLKQHGVEKLFASVKEFPLYMYKIESDLVSLEINDCYRDYFLDNDPTCIYKAARALMTIQGIFGLIPTIYGKGTAAKQVYDLMVSMRRELAGNEPQVTPQIEQLILIDRSVDLITPLATQLTYEGLIDQFFGINNCAVKMSSDIFAQQNSEDQTNENSPFQEMKTIQLTSAEDLYAEIRDVNFSAVGPKLSSRTKSVSTQFDERLKAKTVGELKQFVQKFPHLQAIKQSLATHTTIAEQLQEKIGDGNFRPALQIEQDFLKGVDTDKINPFIEDCIASQEPILMVLRLICLQSIVNSGLKTKVLEHYKREVIQTYGYDHFLTLENLEKLGLIKVQTGRNTYSTIRKTLRLTVDDVCEKDPTDISYVHSGYAPMSVRLVEFLQGSGWRAITEVLNLLPGPTVTETQQLPTALRQRRSSGGSFQSSGETGTALVFFIGGCTYSEVAAIRFLTSRMDQGGPDYVIGTTKLINGNTFIDSLTEKLHLQF